MREKLIEQKLIKAVKDIGGIALKIVSPGFDGMPDRLILLPNRKAAFVEVKACLLYTSHRQKRGLSLR